jgi:hypothetical protein
MDVLLITLGALAFAVSVVLIDQRWQRDERERDARRWEERERLLNRGNPTPSRREARERSTRPG